MLRNPARTYEGSELERIASFGCLRRKRAEELGEGLIGICHFSGDIFLFGGNDWDRSYPEVEGVEVSGVCDSPVQFMEKFGELLRDDPKELCVTFTHVPKNPENKNRGGGWRWHKWGEYIGEGTPEEEYLDDEEGFENGIYCYSVYDISGLT